MNSSEHSQKRCSCSQIYELLLPTLFLKWQKTCRMRRVSFVSKSPEVLILQVKCVWNVLLIIYSKTVFLKSFGYFSPCWLKGNWTFASFLLFLDPPWTSKKKKWRVVQRVHKSIFLFFVATSLHYYAFENVPKAMHSITKQNWERIFFNEVFYQCFVSSIHFLQPENFKILSGLLWIPRWKLETWKNLANENCEP